MCCLARKVWHDGEHTPALLPIRNTVLSLTVSPPSSPPPSASRLWTSAAACSHSVSELTNTRQKRLVVRKNMSVIMLRSIKTGIQTDSHLIFGIKLNMFYNLWQLHRPAKRLQPKETKRCQSNGTLWWCNNFLQLNEHCGKCSAFVETVKLLATSTP